MLSTLTDDSPDLPGAIRWLEVSWSNSRLITQPTRVLALRAGFDVLSGGAATATVRAQLSALLDPDGAARTQRRWLDHGNERSAELTDLEWWFQSFALLRNKIAHGGAIAADEYDFDDGVPHVLHGEYNLRRAIKQIVADAGHPEVLLDAFDRIALRFGELIAEEDAQGEEPQAQ